MGRPRAAHANGALGTPGPGKRSQSAQNAGLSAVLVGLGAELRLRADSICVHGDKPSAVAQARGVRDALLAEGYTLGTLPEVVGYL